MGVRGSAAAAAAGLLAALVAGCSAAVGGDGHAAARGLTADDRLYLAMVRTTAGSGVAGYGDAQLIRAAQGMCAELRLGPGGPLGVRAEPPVPTGLPGASATALAAVSGWGGWVYCPDLTLPH